MAVFFSLLIVLVGAHVVMIWGPVPNGGTRILDNLSGAILTMLLFQVRGITGGDAVAGG